MKKFHYLTIVSIAAFIVFSCGSKKEKAATEDYGTPKEEAATPVAGDAIAQGESLVKASDCKTCHHPTNKIIGPAHTDVAKKYEFTEANVKLLAQRTRGEDTEDKGVDLKSPYRFPIRGANHRPGVRLSLRQAACRRDG